MNISIKKQFPKHILHLRDKNATIKDAPAVLQAHFDLKKETDSTNE